MHRILLESAKTCAMKTKVDLLKPLPPPPLKKNIAKKEIFENPIKTYVSTAKCRVGEHLSGRPSLIHVAKF